MISNGVTQRSDLRRNTGLADGIPLGFREFDINPLLADRVVHFAEGASERFERGWIHSSFLRRIPGPGKFISRGTASTGSAVFFPVNALFRNGSDSCGPEVGTAVAMPRDEMETYPTTALTIASAPVWVAEYKVIAGVLGALPLQKQLQPLTTNNLCKLY